MSLRWFYRPDWVAGHPAVEFTDSVRLYTTDVTEHAEEGSVAASTILVDDPTGALDFPPLTSLYATETENSATSNTYVYHGYIAERAVHRGDSTLTGSARVWEVSVVDENSLLSRRVLSSASANRPSESDVTRMLWLANLADGQQLIDDTSMVSAANAVLMDANDYRGQTALDVANDCAEAGRKNFWLRFNENVNGAALWYGKGSVTTDTSMVRLSNDLDDIDSLTTFAISADTVLNRSPSRLLSSVYYQYTNGAVYVRNQAMIPLIGLRDAPMSSSNVKTLARATSRADGILADLDTEEDRITTSVRLPAAKVNWIRAGMRLQFKATHLPQYESFVWLRVYRRSVAQDSEESYLLTLELGSDDIPAMPTSQAPQVFSVVMGAQSGMLGQSSYTEIQYSDDGGSFTTLFDGADIAANLTEEFLFAAVPSTDLRHRYWRVVWTKPHPGGFFDGVLFNKAMRLLGPGTSLDNDRLGTLGGGGDGTYWKPAVPQTNLITPLPTYQGTCSVALLFGASNGVYFTGATSHAGDFSVAPGHGPLAEFGVGAGVFGATTVVATWTWDLGIE